MLLTVDQGFPENCFSKISRLATPTHPPFWQLFQLVTQFDCPVGKKESRRKVEVEGRRRRRRRIEKESLLLLLLRVALSSENISDKHGGRIGRMEWNGWASDKKWKARQTVAALLSRFFTSQTHNLLTAAFFKTGSQRMLQRRHCFPKNALCLTRPFICLPLPGRASCRGWGRAVNGDKRFLPLILFLSVSGCPDLEGIFLPFLTGNLAH